MAEHNEMVFEDPVSVRGWIIFSGETLGVLGLDSYGPSVVEPNQSRPTRTRGTERHQCARTFGACLQMAESSFQAGPLDAADSAILKPDNRIQSCTQESADDRADDGYPGVLPVRTAFAWNWQDRVREPRRQVAGRIDGVPGRSAE